MPEHRNATQVHKGRYIQTADPGAVGAGVEWLDTNTTPAIHKKRNAGDSGWDVVLNPALYALLTGATFTGDVIVPDEAYDATAWNGSLEAPTKNAVRDKIEALGSGYTDEQAQDAVGAMVDASLAYVDATPLLQRAALTGDVTASAGSNATTIASDAVTYAKMQNVAAASRLLGRGDSGAGDPQEITLGTGLTMTGTTLAASGGGGGGGGGSYPGDDPQAVQNAADDHFDGPALDTVGGGADATRHASATPWSWRNQGGTTWTQLYGVGSMMVPTNAGDSYRMIDQPAPAGAWRYEAKMRNATVYSVNYNWFGMHVTDGTKIDSIVFLTDGANFLIGEVYMNSATSFGASTNNHTIRQVFGDGMYFAIARDGSGVLTFEYSFDRINWELIVSQAQTTRLGVGGVTNIGLFGETNQTTRKNIVTWEFFEKVA